MFDLSVAQQILALVVGVPVLVAVTTLLFLAGCALADVNPPRLPRAVGVATLALAVCVPLGWVAVYFLGQLDADPSVLLGPMRLAGVGLSLLGAWVVSTILYALFLAAPYRKGMMSAAIELLLGALLSGLLAGVTLVVLALVQINRKPEVPQVPKAEPSPKAFLSPAHGSRGLARVS